MSNKVRCGVLGVPKIVVGKVIPTMQRGEWSEVGVIASLGRGKTEGAAHQLVLPGPINRMRSFCRARRSRRFTIRFPTSFTSRGPGTREAGTACAGAQHYCQEARTLVALRRPMGVNASEAFMGRTHPQWLPTRELITSGRIGRLRSVLIFSCINRDPPNIRNFPACCGLGLMDIGCYPITMSHFALGEEPPGVLGLIERGPEMKTDRLTSAPSISPRGMRFSLAVLSLFSIHGWNSGERMGTSRPRSRLTRRTTSLAGPRSTTDATF